MTTETVPAVKVTELTTTARFVKSTKRKHRFDIEDDAGILVGPIYVSKEWLQKKTGGTVPATIEVTIKV